MPGDVYEDVAKSYERERWGSRVGLILAAAGNAIGIGNLLRFPSQAAQNGGGAFIISYIISLLLLGIPMGWVMWVIGRYGGKFGHSSTPGMFDKLWNKPISKYIGTIGLMLPLVFTLFYTYVESWCLAYSFFSLTGDYFNVIDLDIYLNEFIGSAPSNNYFSSLRPAFIFFVITFFLNIYVLSRGIVKGIERLVTIAMPLLFVFGILMIIRVFTLPAVGSATVGDGFGFIWNPDFSRITDVNVWIAATGQIFFSLSIGLGALECYASYVRKNEDIALNALTTTATNEFVEVIMGSSIAIPATALFFGISQVGVIASKGSYNIGFVSMPEILRNFPMSHIFGAIWFLLLFFAAYTSSVAISQPVMAFFQDELKLKRKTSAIILGIIWLIGTVPLIIFQKYGCIDELDFWIGTLFLVIFATIEVILLAWVFGIKKTWDELNEGADIKVPIIFKFIIKYITPLILLVLLFFWGFKSAPQHITPQPRIVESINNREKIRGLISSYIPEEFKEENTKVKGKIKEYINRTKSDFKLDFTVAVDDKGNITNVSYSPKNDSKHTEDIIKLCQEYIQLRRYEPFKEKGSNKAQAITFELSIAGLYTKPYIWFARILIIASYIFFAFLVFIAWRKKK